MSAQSRVYFGRHMVGLCDYDRDIFAETMIATVLICLRKIELHRNRRRYLDAYRARPEAVPASDALATHDARDVLPTQ